MQDEKPDYEDWSDQELHEELKYLDEKLIHYQTVIVDARKKLNFYMESHEDLLDIIKQRAQRKGWQKK